MCVRLNKRNVIKMIVCTGRCDKFEAVHYSVFAAALFRLRFIESGKLGGCRCLGGNRRAIRNCHKFHNLIVGHIAAWPENVRSTQKNNNNYCRHFIRAGNAVLMGFDVFVNSVCYCISASASVRFALASSGSVAYAHICRARPAIQMGRGCVSADTAAIP